MDNVVDILKNIVAKYPRTIIALLLLVVVILLPVKLTLIVLLLLITLTFDFKAQNITWKEFIDKVKGIFKK